jgi:hypothetical protein
MSLTRPGERNEIASNRPHTCHVCGKQIEISLHVVEHVGHVMTANSLAHEERTYGGISMHTQCAAVLAMRLLGDVMHAPSSAEEPRAVDLLRRAK